VSPSAQPAPSSPAIATDEAPRRARAGATKADHAFVATPAPVSADSSQTLVRAWFKECRQAAAKPDCETVRALGHKIAHADPAFFGSVVLKDPLLRRCLPVPQPATAE
jgi:hypothetical protein